MEYTIGIRRTMKAVITLCLVLTGLIWMGCKKCGYDENYTGKYEVTKTLRCYGYCDTCFSEKDTVIIVSCGSKRNTLNVLGRVVTLNEDGEFSDYHYFLRFRNGTIYSNHMQGGLECGTAEKYEGHKISD